MVPKKFFVIHGYLTILALILHIILFMIVMIPSFGTGFCGLDLSLPYVLIFWSHVILGTVAAILVFVIIGFWASRSISKMGCVRMKKVMMPLLMIWAISLINGDSFTF